MIKDKTVLENYLKRFSKLRTDRGRNRYPAATIHYAPHKPFLLMSILDLIAQGLITNNFIEPSFELVGTWNGHDDHPANGMCLCRLCHWSFDEGLMSVGKEYEVLVSNRVRMDNNIPAHILPLTDRKIFTPEETRFWPSQDNLQKHYKTIYAN